MRAEPPLLDGVSTDEGGFSRKRVSAGDLEEPRLNRRTSRPCPELPRYANVNTTGDLHTRGGCNCCGGSWMRLRRAGTLLRIGGAGGPSRPSQPPHPPIRTEHRPARDPLTPQHHPARDRCRDWPRARPDGVAQPSSGPGPGGPAAGRRDRAATLRPGSDARGCPAVGPLPG